RIEHISEHLNIGNIQWKKSRKYKRKEKPEEYRDPPVEEKTSHNIYPDSQGKNLKNIGILQEKPEEYRDPPVGEEEKTSHNIFLDSQGKNLKNIGILQREKRRKQEEKTSHNIFPDSRGKNLKNIEILQDPPVGEEEKMSHNIFPDSQGKICRILGSSRKNLINIGILHRERSLSTRELSVLSLSLGELLLLSALKLNVQNKLHYHSSQ
ncbi:hypothetical protein L9F63_013142, partial [Diploptera punctata]